MDSRGTNLVATLGTALGDLITSRTAEATGLTGAAPAALTAIRANPGLSVDALARTVGVTGSGGVRLVDRLAAAGLVERRTGADARTVSLRLTPAGQDAAHEVLIARQGAVRGLVRPLDRDEQVTLVRLAEKILTATATTPDHADHLCRLCDTDACPRRRCPVEQSLA